MTPDIDELTWAAEHRREIPDPDGLATDRARLALMELVSQETAQPRRRRLPWLAGAAATAAVAAAVVVVVANGSGSGSTSSGPAASAIGTGAVFAPQTGHGSFVLLHLAHSAAQTPALPGNATLVFRQLHDTDPGHPTWNYSGYDLYEDNGDYYFGRTIPQLQKQLASPANASTFEGKIIAAAATSASATPAQAASNVWAADMAGSSPAVRSAHYTTFMRDNRLWVDITLALEGGPGKPDVRAGALLAASVLPDVTVTDTTVDGQPVKQITNSQFPDGYSETFEVNAQTGVLVRFHGGGATSGTGVGSSANATYQTSRVTTPSLRPAPLN